MHFPKEVGRRPDSKRFKKQISCKICIDDVSGKKDVKYCQDCFFQAWCNTFYQDSSHVVFRLPSPNIIDIMYYIMFGWLVSGLSSCSCLTSILNPWFIITEKGHASPDVSFGLKLKRVTCVDNESCPLSASASTTIIRNGPQISDP